MEELINPEFRETYIRDMCKKLFDIDVYQKDIEFIAEGVMNYVYKGRTAKSDIFLKQSLKKAKFHDRIGNNLASVSFKRIKYQKNVIANIQDKLPGSFRSLPNARRKNPRCLLSSLWIKKSPLLYLR